MDTKQPTPVRTAILILGAVNIIVVGVFPVLQVFDVISWTSDQMSQVVTFLALFTNTVGGTITSIFAENRVTPVASPRDDTLTPLVPIASDGLDD